MEIHLDLLGGLAGDMFIAALLDAWPQHESRVREAIDMTRGPLPVCCALVTHQDHVLRGSRFDVLLTASPPQPKSLQGGSHHEHIAWKTIRSRLLNSPLPRRVCRHAVHIFELLAAAEAQVHGVAADAVEFHEVGAWDSVADIVGAATLIDALEVTRWTCSAVPLGSGRVATAHGILPVPTPATARLLLGMPTIDDGVPGERVTPTGAAVLRYLMPPDAATTTRQPHAKTLLATGTGFGSRMLPGLSNHVRALCFERSLQSASDRAQDGGPVRAAPRRLRVIEFEVDDQSGEDLATGLERMRSQEGVLDITQAPVFGKKGRMTVHVRVLARAEQLQSIVAACFAETTTIGLRHHEVEAVGLEREILEATVDGQILRVKVVDRAGRPSAKTESDDVRGHPNHQRRAALRRRAEAQVLSRRTNESDITENMAMDDEIDA